LKIGHLKSSTVLFAFCFMAFCISKAGAAESDMVKVAAGEIKQDQNGKAVKVGAFKIDKHEVTFAQFNSFNKEFEIPEGKEDHPITEVTFFDAEEYCKHVGKRLPTGAEWELAASGTDGRLYPWGNEFDSTKANTLESGRNGTSPVGAYPDGASPSGALDMSGNVWEWVDQYESSEKRYRLVLGGSFFDKKENCTNKSSLKSIPDDSHTYIGFRCAK